MTLRLRRLLADYERISKLFKDNPHIYIKSAFGNPPERYHVEYHVKGLAMKGKTVVEKDTHLVEIVLTRGYPRQAPQCRMLTPVFHPNIAPHAICIGDQWAAGESLAHLIVRIGEMICYQSYNIKSPLNGEAAKWADENIGRLPIDTTDLTLQQLPEDIIVTAHDLVPSEVTDIAESEKEEIKMEEEVYVAEEHVSTPVEPIATEAIEIKRNVARCDNCGETSSDAYIDICSNHHNLCENCIYTCDVCEQKKCIICDIKQCPSCGKFRCQSCVDACCPTKNNV